MARAKITWLGHSAFHLVNGEGKVALIDPFLNDNPSCPDRFKNPEQVDLILLTHGHFDHVGDAVALAKKFKCPVVGAVELCQLLGQELPKDVARPMNIGGMQVIAGFTVTMTLALHSSSYQVKGQPMYAGTPAGYVISAAGSGAFYHTGDTDVFSDMNLIAALHAPRIVALPIGGHYTMGPRAAALAIEMLRPHCVIPMHYGTWPQLPGTAVDFRSELSLRGLQDVRILAMEPGESQEWLLGECG
jgi:L-ascorbate metabolism protein UlaG (beta-lactamase superfamily)